MHHPDTNTLFLVLLVGVLTMATFNLSTYETNLPDTDRAEYRELVEEAFEEPKQPLNIVLLYADDWRHDSLGIAGTQMVQTPFLDRFSMGNMRFTHNCVTTSVCWISRATLHSGMYYSRHQTREAGIPTFYKLWEHSFPTLLKKAGYYLGHIGKWNFVMNKVDSHVWNTFDVFSAYEGRHWLQSMVHVTEQNKMDSVEFLQKRPKDKPFFLNVAFFAPHADDETKEQYQPQLKSMSLYINDTIPYPINGRVSDWEILKNKSFSERFLGRKRFGYRFDTPIKHQIMIKNYYRLISEVDSAAESIYEELEQQGILNETMVIFTTDNGYFHAEHGLAGKWLPFEESLRVPLIISDPRMHPKHKGTTNDEFTLNVDLAPTILSAAGITAPDLMQGRDISEIYRKECKDWRTEFLYEIPFLYAIKEWPSTRALIRKAYKYIEYTDYGSAQFFDMKADPKEMNDLLDDPKQKERIIEMKARLNELHAAARMPESLVGVST